MLWFKKELYEKQPDEHLKRTKQELLPREKKKQFAKDKAEFDYDSNDDTTGRSEAFKPDKINGPKKEK